MGSGNFYGEQFEIFHMMEQINPSARYTRKRIASVKKRSSRLHEFHSMRRASSTAARVAWRGQEIEIEIDAFAKFSSGRASERASGRSPLLSPRSEMPPSLLSSLHALSRALPVLLRESRSGHKYLKEAIVISCLEWRERGRERSNFYHF